MFSGFFGFASELYLKAFLDGQAELQCINGVQAEAVAK